MSTTKNQQFSSSIGFIATAAGAAVGLGNIWKFPYEAGRGGGGAFLLIYLIFIALLGYPLLVCKTALGRRLQGGVYHTYAAAGKWKLLGFFTTLIPVLVLSFYSVVAGWTVGYTLALLQGNLTAGTAMGPFFGQLTSNFPTNLGYTATILVLTAIIVAGGVQQGLERISKVMMPLFLLLLLGLIGYALTLPGAGKGVAFYLIPKVGDITLHTLHQALGQSFLSLALGGGVFITYGAYMKADENLPKTALAVVLSDTLVAFLAGLMIFPLIFHQSIAPTAGPPLVFIALPQAFQALGPVAGPVVGIAFFVLLLFAAITSTISMLEIPVKYLMEAFSLRRTPTVIGMTGFICLLSLPSMLSFGGPACLTRFWGQKHFMDCLIGLVDFGMPLICLLFCVHLGQRWERDGLAAELRQGSNVSNAVITYLRCTITYVAPALIGLVLVGNLLL